MCDSVALPGSHSVNEELSTEAVKGGLLSTAGQILASLTALQTLCQSIRGPASSSHASAAAHV